MNDEHVQSTEILLFMEATLYPRTTKMRERCRKWHHKLNLQGAKYPTLTKLAAYRRIYENWDGLETFPSREVQTLRYYLD